MGPIICEVPPEPKEQEVLPKVTGKSPPFGPRELASPLIGHHSESPSTVPGDHLEEFSLPFLLLESEPPRESVRYAMPLRRRIVELLVECSDLPHAVLTTEIEQNSDGDLLLAEAFRLLLPKFKTARKTREEMVKYCMRKAFSFL
jgi:hypothetical protein